MTLRRLACLLLLLLFFSTISAQQDTLRVGLVLSGGGARGLAHIGVIKVLEEAGVQVQCVAGTSMGSIIGGLYAICYSGAELDSLARHIDWDAIVFDQLSRRDISMEEKEEQARYIGMFPFDWKTRSISLPSGLVAGQNFQTLVSRLTLSVHHIGNFNDFPRPFVCLATDLETGDAVVMNTGSLADAIRASMSIPSMFTPVERDGRLLVDGGIVRNYPVSEVRELGANYIIGCDVSTMLYKKNELQSLVRVMQQCLNFGGYTGIMDERENTNILILPDVDRYSITDFQKADTLIALGERAAREHLPELLALAQRQSHDDEDAPRPLLAIDSLFVVNIHTQGLKHVSKNLVIGKLGLNDHAWIHTSDLDRAVTRLYGSQYFERVTYTLAPVQGGVDLVLHLVERKTQVFRFGIRYNTDLKSAVLLNLTFRNLLVEGSKLSVDWKLSELPGLYAGMFIHTGWKPGFGLGLYYRGEEFEAYEYNDDGDRLSGWNYHRGSMILTLQTLFSTNWSFGVSGEAGGSSITCTFHSDTEPVDDFDIGFISAYAFLAIDTLDRPVFPTKGVQLYAQARTLGAQFDLHEETYTPVIRQYLLRYQEIAEIEEHFSTALRIWAGVNHGEIGRLPDRVFYLGGTDGNLETQFPFSGLRWMEEGGADVWMTQAELQWEFMKSGFALCHIDIGKTGDDMGEVFKAEHILTGYGAGVGFNTPIGPMRWDLGWNSKLSNPITTVRIGYQF